MKPIRFALIGCSPIGRIHAESISKTEGAQLTAVSDVNLEQANKLAAHYSACVYADEKEMLKSPDIDAVSICLPHHLHYEYCMDAIKAGKHVLIEKPLAISAADVSSIYNGHQPLINGYEGLRSLYLLEALYLSADTRQWVPMAGIDV
jgi:predicted dehydrogenase